MWYLYLNGTPVCCADDMPAFYLNRFCIEFPQFEVRKV